MACEVAELSNVDPMAVNSPFRLKTRPAESLGRTGGRLRRSARGRVAGDRGVDHGDLALEVEDRAAHPGAAAADEMACAGSGVRRARAIAGGGGRGRPVSSAAAEAAAATAAGTAATTAAEAAAPTTTGHGRRAAAATDAAATRGLAIEAGAASAEASAAAGLSDGSREPAAAAGSVTAERQLAATDASGSRIRPAAVARQVGRRVAAGLIHSEAGSPAAAADVDASRATRRAELAIERAHAAAVQRVPGEGDTAARRIAAEGAVGGTAHRTVPGERGALDAGRAHVEDRAAQSSTPAAAEGSTAAGPRVLQREVADRELAGARRHVVERLGPRGIGADEKEAEAAEDLSSRLRVAPLPSIVISLAIAGRALRPNQPPPWKAPWKNV